MSALDKIRANHRAHVSANFPEPGICVSDRNGWPCESAVLLAALDAASGALERHMQFFTEDGRRICAGCLEPVPCPDRDVITRALEEGNQGG